MKMVNLGFLASGRGSNMQAVVDACVTGRLRARPCVVISNNSDSPALARASQEGIRHYHLSTRTHPQPSRLDEAILQKLSCHSTDLVILAGYMRKLGPKTVARYTGRTLNIHPALLPKFGGKGMYGLRVHRAVLAAGERETGVTIHVVDGEYDTGSIVAQCRVPVLVRDTAESLSRRVLEREHMFLVETLEGIISGAIALPAVEPA